MQNLIPQETVTFETLSVTGEVAHGEIFDRTNSHSSLALLNLVTHGGELRWPSLKVLTLLSDFEITHSTRLQRGP